MSPPRASRKRLAAGTIGVSIAVLVGVIFYSGELLRLSEDQFAILQRKGTLQIYCLDVNQASATLIVTPSHGHAILVDAGGEASGKRLILPILELIEQINGKNIPKIDLMVITHYDSDHIDGADEVLQNPDHPVAELFDHGDHAHWLPEKNSDALRDYVHAATNRAGAYSAIPLNFDRTIDGVRIRCLASNGKTRFDPAGSAFGPDLHDDNPNSVALLISWQGFDFYVAGDQTGETEARIVGQTLPDGHNLNVDVYHMNHHGSETHGSSGDAFLAMLEPEVAIASNGKHSTFKHPHSRPVNKLLGMGAKVFLLNANPHSPVSISADYVSDDSPSFRDGSLAICVDTNKQEYYVLVPELAVSNATFAIETN